MDTAVSLVTAYLQLNGYFVQTEVPIVERLEEDPPRFRQTTDIDVLAVRFPSSVHLGSPAASGQWATIVGVDPGLESPEQEMDVIIGEVKEGQTRLNPNLTRPAVLEAALWHSGGCMGQDLEKVARELRETGEASAEHCHGGRQRIRLVAFGGTRPQGGKEGCHVVPLEDVFGFLKRTVSERPEVFGVIDAKDPALGMILLRWKVVSGD